MQYSVDNLVRLAKRDNNYIRPYLYVNPMQGKHIPTKPEDAMKMCRELAKIVNTTYPEDSLYIIGFAETATGIASAVSAFLNNAAYYQNTTREYRDDEDYLYFTESHSHATDQMLRSSGIEKYIHEINRIIFIDDEVTTGSTICKLIDIIKEKYSVKRLKFSIISILNSMTAECIHRLKEKGIDCIYLSDIPYEYKKGSIMDIPFEDKRHTVVKLDRKPDLTELSYASSINPRGIVKFSDYENDNNNFAEIIEQFLVDCHYKNMLVLGTEEFMYPTFKVGDLLCRKGIAEAVRIHSTTRSPIIASGEFGYPLYHRYQIRSLYDEGRTTFIYNLEKYEKVMILTDAMRESKGLFDLCAALNSVGNDNITIVKWVYKQ